MTKRLLNTTEAAQYASCLPNYLEKLRCAGGGPVYIKMHGRVLYDIADIDQWIDGMKRRSTSDVKEVA